MTNESLEEKIKQALIFKDKYFENEMHIGDGVDDCSGTNEEMMEACYKQLADLFRQTLKERLVSEKKYVMDKINDSRLHQKFKTKEEAQAFNDSLDQAIEIIKGERND